jgi:hypothetical protein
MAITDVSVELHSAALGMRMTRAAIIEQAS